MKKLELIIDIQGENANVRIGEGIELKFNTVKIHEDFNIFINMFKNLCNSLAQADDIEFDDSAINRIAGFINLYNETIGVNGRLRVHYTFQHDGTYNINFEGDLTTNIIAWIKTVEELLSINSNKQL